MICGREARGRLKVGGLRFKGMEIPVLRATLDASWWFAAVVTGARWNWRECADWTVYDMDSVGVDECRSNGSLSALEKVNNVLKPVACCGNTFLSEVAESGCSRATFTCNGTITSLRVGKTCVVQAYVCIYKLQGMLQ